jgi:hypothetical protein
MARELKILFGSLLILLLMVGVGTVISAHAQTPTPPVPAGGQLGPGPRGPHQLGQAELDAAAKALGISADDLSTQLKNGKTLAEMATAHGVDPQTVMQAIQAARPPKLGPTGLDAAAKALAMTSSDLSAQIEAGKSLADIASAQGVDVQTVQDAIQAARNAQMKTQINQAVTSGRISQDKANWLLEGLSQGFLNGPDGFGFGFRIGGPGPHAPGGRLPQPAPSTTP